MGAILHTLWSLTPAAARAAWGEMASKRPLWLLVFAVVCVVVALRVGRAPQRERWAAIRRQWLSELRDACAVMLAVGLLVFGWELYQAQQNETWQKLLQDPKFLSELSSRVPMRSSAGFESSLGLQTHCVQVLLPAGFSGGSYALPYKPAGPSPPVLYDNGQMQRKGVDFTISDGKIVVNFKPTSKDSLSVWYTTDDPFSGYLP